MEIKEDNHSIEWLKEILTRCGRNNILVKNNELWEIRNSKDELIDSDTKVLIVELFR